MVNRKTWGGNRTWDGAIAQAVVATVLGTVRRRLGDPIESMRRVLCAGADGTPASLNIEIKLTAVCLVDGKRSRHDDVSHVGLESRAQSDTRSAA